MTVEIIKRNYIVLTTDADAAAVQADLNTIPEVIAAGVTFNIVEGLGPEAAPDAGVSSTITHRLDGPLHDDALFSTVRAYCAAHWPDVYVHDTMWWAMDDGVSRCLIPDQPDPRDTLALFQYDETY